MKRASGAAAGAGFDFVGDGGGNVVGDESGADFFGEVEGGEGGGETFPGEDGRGKVDLFFDETN